MMLKVVLILCVHTVAIESGGPFYCVENGIDYQIDVCVPRGPLDNCTCQYTSSSTSSGSVVCTITKCEPVSCPNAIIPAGQCCKICPAVKCPDINERYNETASVEITSLSPGGKATITCNQGFYFYGPPELATMICMSEGHWNTEGPICVKGCVRDGKTLRRGAYIPKSNTDGCFDCSCTFDGMMECWSQCIRYPVCLDGVLPVQDEGNCCPNCPLDFPQIPNNTTTEKGCIAVDGTIIGFGYKMPYPDKCLYCYCQNDGMKCDRHCAIPAECLGGFEPVQIKGNCCPTCPPVCTENGTIYQSGDIMPSPDRCIDCFCDNGTMKCGRECEIPVCVDSAQPETFGGNCCPTCPPVCAENGITYQQGQSVPGGLCDSCTCESSVDGTQASVVCAVIDCAPVTCINAFVPPGQCCAICPVVCTENGITYQQGQSVPKGPCDSCTCISSVDGTQASVVCAAIDCVSVTCSNAFVPPGQCCAICPAVCTENEITYQQGQSVPRGPCDSCTCVSSFAGALVSVVCAVVECASVTCANAYVPPDQCCDVCPAVCTKNGITYQPGEIMPNPDPCWPCVCDNGWPLCTEQLCSDLQCTDGALPETLEGNCCPTCPPVCTENGITYRTGQSVLRGPCDSCTCESSVDGTQASVVCVSTECAPVPCNNAFVPSGQCCSICPAVCTENGITYQQGQSVPRGPCDSCTCVSSFGGALVSVVCAAIECAPVTCAKSYVPPGQCCDVCPAVCTENGITYQSGKTIPQKNLCLDCVCDNGQVICSGPLCNDLQCTDGIPPEALEGNCCPTCPSVCVYNDKIFREGERIPDRNPCNMCLCERGELSCSLVICPPKPDCDGKYRPLGQCCLVCPKDSNGNDDVNGYGANNNNNNNAHNNNDINRNNNANRNNGAHNNNDKNRNNNANRNNDAHNNNDKNRNNNANRNNDAQNNNYSNRRQGRH